MSIAINRVYEVKNARKYEIVMLAMEDDESIIFLDLKPLDPCFSFESL